MSALLATSGVFVCVFVMRDGVQQSVSYEVRFSRVKTFFSFRVRFFKNIITCEDPEINLTK